MKYLMKPKEGIELDIEGSTIHITVASPVKVTAEIAPQGRALVSELYSKDGKRSLKLPCEVAQDTTNAVLKDGVLTITVDKATTSSARKIKIK